MKRKKLKTQTLWIALDENGVRYWESDAEGWIPQRAIELESDAFSVGTKLKVEYETETIARKD